MLRRIVASNFSRFGPKFLGSANFSTSRCSFFPKVEVDGVNLNYEAVGEGPHTILCMPGLVGTIELDFGKFFEKVDKEKFKWVAWDPPGYGKSRPPNRDFTGSYCLRDARLAGKMMAALGYDKYSIFGWSQGGATGLFLAGEFPNNVTSLVTLGTASCNDDRLVKVYEIISSIDSWPEERQKEKLAVYDKAYLKKMLSDNLTAAKKSNKSATERGNYLGNHADKIKCPVLHVTGDADTTCTKNHAHQLKTKTKNSRVVIIPKGGHDLHLTHTKQFLDAVVPFYLNGK